MLNKKIADMLNEQVNKELYSAYLYLDFANYYEDEGLDGFAHGTKFGAGGARPCAYAPPLSHRQRCARNLR